MGQFTKDFFWTPVRDKVEEKSQVDCSIEKPCSWKQVDARLQQPVTKIEPWATTDDKPKKLLQFNSNVFVPGSTSWKVQKTEDLQQLLSSAVSMFPTPTTLPSMSVPMNVPKIVLDNLAGGPSEWPERSGQFIATIEQSGIADSGKMNYLKTLITGKAKEQLRPWDTLVKFIMRLGRIWNLIWKT